jgi:hypothetical protein
MIVRFRLAGVKTVGVSANERMSMVTVGADQMRTRLFETATATRLFMEPVWADWHAAWGGERPQPLSRNTCGRTSLFIVHVLRHEGIQATWKTGVPRLEENAPDLGPYGFCRNGRWESHAWVEASGFIVDITADQFGDEPVIVVPAGDPRYSAGEQDTALPTHIANRAIAVAAIWPTWLEFRETSQQSF